YLPAMTTSFTRGGLHVTITDFASKQTIAGSPAELVYTRITETNNGSAAVSAPPRQARPRLVQPHSHPDPHQPGQTVHHDFVAAVDTFAVGGTLPTPDQLTPTPGQAGQAGQAGALPYDTALRQMTSYWDQRLSVIPRLGLPNTPLPNTSKLASPGT